MTDKIKTTTIIAQIAKQCDISRADATLFVEQFSALLEDALTADKIVKINNLGTFKIETTKPRRSVDVNTGNIIEIAAHRKITFTPAPTLASAANHELAHLETIILTDNDTPQDTTPLNKPQQATETNNKAETTNSFTDITSDTATTLPDPNKTEAPLLKLTEEAQSLLTLLSEIQTPTTPEPETIETKTKPIEPEIPPATETPLTTENETTKDETEPTETKTNIEPETKPSTQSVKDNYYGVDASEAVKAINNENYRASGGSKTLWITVACVLALLIIGIVVWNLRSFFISESEGSISTQTITAAIDTAKTDNNYNTEIAAETTDNYITETGNDTETETETKPQITTEEDIVSEPQAPTENSAAVAPTDPFAEPRHYTTFIDTATIAPGSRLTLISLRYYGHKDFWVYIYEANRDIISHPDNVEVGTQVRIPQLPAALIDATSPTALDYAHRLRDRYVK